MMTSLPKSVLKFCWLVLLSTFVTPHLVTGQMRLSARVELEDPGIQRLAIEYYARKYHVHMSEATRRILLQDRAAGIDDDLSNLLGDQFAGIWYDHADRGRLKVGLTQGAMRQAAAVSRLLARYGVTASADLVHVRFSLAELEQKQNTIRDKLIDMVKSGHASTSYNPRLNRVVVTVITALDSAEQMRIRDLSVTPGVVIRRFNVSTLTGRYTSCLVNKCDPPLRGGRAIDAPGGCTAAFMARDRTSGSLLTITAGHCTFFAGGFSSQWSATDESSTSHLIGTTSSFLFAGSSGMDAGAINIDATQFWSSPTPIAALVVKASDQTTYNATYQIKRDSWSSLGQILCRTGRKTGTRCAEVGDLGVDFTADGPDGKTYTTFNLGALDMCDGELGDSGGPIYKRSRAYGILSGIADTPIHCFETYQGIRGAEKALSFDILLAQ